VSGRLDPLLRCLQAVCLIGTVAAVVPVLNAIASWSRKPRWIPGCVGSTLLALACLGFVWIVLDWNMLSTSLRF
jgi:hypothetical protein